MRALRQLLGLESDVDEKDSDSDTVRRIARELERLDPEEARYVAAFAYVLARVANADRDVSDEEVRQMEQLVCEIGGLSGAQGALVVQIAKSRAVIVGATEDYLVTRQFRELSTREQRLRLLECLFAVAAADEHISTVENQQIAQIASELGLTAQEVSVVRGSFREHLAVLKNLPKA